MTTTPRSHSALVALLCQCKSNSESLEATASAIEAFFSEEGRATKPWPHDELVQVFVELARKHDVQAELCQLRDYDPELGRIPEKWVPNSQYLPFFEDAVKFGQSQHETPAAAAKR